MNRIASSVLQLFVIVMAFALLVPPAHAQQQEQEIDWRYTASDWRGQFHKIFTVYCPPTTTRGGTLWGADVYTDDSSICMAAVHSLRSFDHVRGGTVYFQMEPAQEGYDSERRRGIQSETWGAFSGGMRIVGGVPGKRPGEVGDTTPVEITWSSSGRHLRNGGVGDRTVLCPGNGTAQTVWGSGVYADDSSICTAAVHAGIITLAKGGSVTLRAEPGREGYKAAKKHGVQSLAWEKFDGSFSFSRRQVAVALPAPGSDAPRPEPRPATTVIRRQPTPVLLPTGEYQLEWRSTAESWQGRPDIITAWCPPGGSPGELWGSGEYTGDSSVCTAAVHALATFDVTQGGTVYVTMTSGRAAYSGEERRGVSSSPWAEYPFSLRVVAGVPGKKPAEIGDSTVREISWSTTAAHLRGTAREHRFVCPPNGRWFPIWGSDVYSDSSSICGAAVHAAIITRTAGGLVTVRIEPGRDEYTGVLRNEVTSQSFGSAPGSFSFRRD